MRRLDHMARSVAPGKGVHFREHPYGSKAIENFLRDVLAMANASVDSRRFIGPGLIGRRFGIRYALHGQNLSSPATRMLRLNFRD